MNVGYGLEVNEAFHNYRVYLRVKPKTLEESELSEEEQNQLPADNEGEMVIRTLPNVK